MHYMYLIMLTYYNLYSNEYEISLVHIHVCTYVNICTLDMIWRNMSVEVEILHTSKCCQHVHMHQCVFIYNVNSDLIY